MWTYVILGGVAVIFLIFVIGMVLALLWMTHTEYGLPCPKCKAEPIWNSYRQEGAENVHKRRCLECEYEWVVDRAPAPAEPYATNPYYSLRSPYSLF